MTSKTPETFEDTLSGLKKYSISIGFEQQLAAVEAAHTTTLEAAKREARVDEVKRSLYKGYFIPEMEVYAEDRIAQLSHPNQPKENQDEAL